MGGTGGESLKTRALGQKLRFSRYKDEVASSLSYSGLDQFERKGV
jgi:hypothetical protein